MDSRTEANGSQLRVLERRVRRQRRVLWMGFAAVFIPLAVLIALQYRWLVDLERTSSVARRASLAKVLDAVAKEVYYTYKSLADRTLDVSPAVFSREGLLKAAHRFVKKAGPDAAAVRHFFLVDFADPGPILVLDPRAGVFEVPSYSAETLAIWAAAAPWEIRFKKGAPVELSIVSDERDRDFPILLKPIVDDGSRLVGLSGMILDRDHFAAHVLPQAIAQSVQGLAKGDELHVAASDGAGRPVVGGGVKSGEKGWVVGRGLSLVFTDYKLALRDRRATPEKWARRNFALNMILSAVLAVVLLAGVVLALRNAAREMHLSAMKSDFVSNVSHELRTPVSSIQVFGEMMRLGRVSDPGKVREYGEHIETESRRLSHLINNILDFSRIESGRKVYEFEPADVDEVVRAAVSGFRSRVRSQGFDIAYRGPDDPLPAVHVDRAALDQAVSNLLDNAVKYSGERKEVTVRVGRRDASVAIAVEDRGIGIPRAEQGRIFERFHRVASSLVHDVRGSGLGLAIVRHIVEAHSGRVEVESEVGRGSTFTVILPIEAGRPRPPKRGARVSEGATPP
ncbi:MAG: ATP-binding protein [Acidobacteriota bacterium]